MTTDSPDPWERLPRIAERLGCAPAREGHPVSVFLSTKDGRKYDLFELIDALLNRIEKRT